MAFTTPRTWNIGETVTKAMLDEQIRDNENAIWVGTTTGDMDYYSSATAKTRIALGSQWRTLRVYNGVPTWTIDQYCTVYNSTTQSVANTTETIVTWNSQVSDVWSMHSTVSNTHLITVPETGVYAPFASIYFNRNSGGIGTFHMTGRIYANGVATANKITLLEEVDTATKMFTFGGIPVSVAAGSTFYVTFSQNSGDAGLIYGTDANYSSFQVKRLS